MTTKTPPLRVELSHEEGDTSGKPLTVNVYGHHHTPEAARALAQAALDEWCDDNDYECAGEGEEPPPRPQVAVGVHGWVRILPPDGDGVRYWRMQDHAGSGASAVIEFEVDEHLVPRCEVDGCDLRWSSGGGNGDTRRMCRSHSVFRTQRRAVRAHLNMIETHAAWILGLDDPDPYFGAWTVDKRREWALTYIEGETNRMLTTLRHTATLLPPHETKGFTHTTPALAEGTTDQKDTL